MTTNNEALAALERILKQRIPNYYGGYDPVDETAIRTVILKSAQVDGLIEIVTAIRDTATGDSVTISAIKEAAREQLK